MKGYLGRPEATAETLRGGWLHSGDLGYVDSDGFFFIVDRAKDLVIRGGYNVYPREIEEVLYAHPDIVEAAVIGKPDERLGEEVVAIVVARPGSELGAQDVIAYCRERLAAYKYPREIRFIGELPKGPSGKILKAALREGGLCVVGPPALGELVQDRRVDVRLRRQVAFSAGSYGVQFGGLIGCGGRFCGLDGKTGQNAIQPARQGPVGRADEVHDGGHQQAADEQGVDQD
jgi:hypothetical protein